MPDLFVDGYMHIHLVTIKTAESAHMIHQRLQDRGSPLYPLCRGRAGPPSSSQPTMATSTLSDYYCSMGPIPEQWIRSVTMTTGPAVVVSSKGKSQLHTCKGISPPPARANSPGHSSRRRLYCSL